MYNIIPLILISISILIILIIIVRKFKALANLDVENMPAEKEAKFKEQIASSRLQRNLTKWGAVILRSFKFTGEKIGLVFKLALNKLQEVKKEYKDHKAPTTEEEKEQVMKELVFKNEELNIKDDFLEKESNLIKIIELDSKNVDAFNSLGELYFENKKYEEAKQAFVHVLKLIPDEEKSKQANIYYDLSLVYKETDEKIEALETIKMASKLIPNNPRYLDALLEISLITNNKEIAEEALAKLKEVNPENAKIGELQEKIDNLGQKEA